MYYTNKQMRNIFINSVLAALLLAIGGTLLGWAAETKPPWWGIYHTIGWLIFIITTFWLFNNDPRKFLGDIHGQKRNARKL
jgi:membrane protein YdbS with pleckstrin-like domain